MDAEWIQLKNEVINWKTRLRKSSRRRRESKKKNLLKLSVMEDRGNH